MDNKPYVFISYAHADSGVVLPCVNAMKSSGINLWYDEGIEAGSEWPEFIAEKVVSCTKFVLFVSKAYLVSQNCKRELNFAISRKKDILSIFLEDVELSPGMEMQLGTYQAIYRKRFESAAAFHSSLCSEHYFNICRPEGSVNNTPPSQPRTVSPSANTGTVSGTNTAPSQSSASGQFSAESFSAAFSNFFGSGTAVAQKTNTQTSQSNYDPVKAQLPLKNRIIAALLAIFLGTFGIHKFYLKQNGMGVLYLLFCWTYIPSFVGFIEGIIMLCTTDQKFEEKYKCRVS